MGVFEALILGIVQGLTKFLPVSSSGHLVIVRNMLGVTEVPLFFDAMLHLGTLVAVVIVLFSEIAAMLRHPVKNHLGMLILATIPAGVIGIVFQDFFTEAFEGAVLGYCFLATAGILVLSEFLAQRFANKHDVTMPGALSMGLMQALAIFPGISRSGSTIAGGLFTGTNREKAANFAFLMSIPVILASVLLTGKDAAEAGSMGEVSLPALIAGTAAAAVSGFLAVKFMLSLIKKKKLYGFAVYVAILGVYVLLDQQVFHLIFAA